jgi:type II secretion system protein H
MRPRLLPRRQAGFSISEMLVVVAIIGLMALISMPQFMNFFKSMKVRTAANRLMSHARLCRQVAVSKRTPVLLEIRRTNGTTTPRWMAWEERDENIERDANGADDTVNTVDDERWVVREEKQMAHDKVTLVDAWNDTTPADPLDALTEAVTESDFLRLKFLPNGQVQRVTAANVEINTDNTIRVRMQRQVTSARVDQWDVTINRVGKVAGEFSRVSP